MDDRRRLGGCLCGLVRYQVRGEPFTSGLCHCADCRKVTGTAFLASAHWRSDQFEYTGAVATYAGRSFCPSCGSRLFSASDDRVEIYIGSVDEAPNDIAPQTEIWIKRREAWLSRLNGVVQHQENP